MEAMNIGLLGSALGRIFGFYENPLRTLGGPRACVGESLHPGVLDLCPLERGCRLLVLLTSLKEWGMRMGMRAKLGTCG